MKEDRGSQVSPPEENGELVKNFLSGDKRAFDRLVLKYQDRVFNLCYRFLGDYQEAEDLAQEIFVKIYRRLRNFRGDSALYTWIYRIAVNDCKNKLTSRQYRRRRRMVRLDNPGGENICPPEIGEDRLTPRAIVEGKERQFLIQKAINSLPPEQKMVVVLRDIEGLPYEEIARVSGLNLGTVKSRLFRARAELREKLKELV